MLVWRTNCAPLKVDFRIEIKRQADGWIGYRDLDLLELQRMAEVAAEARTGSTYAL